MFGELMAGLVPGDKEVVVGRVERYVVTRPEKRVTNNDFSLQVLGVTSSRTVPQSTSHDCG